MTLPLHDWYAVHFDQSIISLDVHPPGASPWRATLLWGLIVRVCFRAGDWMESDAIYIFTSERPESYVIPIEANGAQALWAEIFRRNLFDAEMAIEAAHATDQLFCSPQHAPQVAAESGPLASTDQLPAIADDPLILTWDQIGPNSLILHGDTLIWRERTGWEVYDRFEEIAAICKQKYGKRLKDIVPTQRSLYALYGDSTAAYFHVEFARKALGKDE